MVLDFLNEAQLSFLTSLGFVIPPNKEVNDDIVTEMVDKCVDIEVSYVYCSGDKKPLGGDCWYGKCVGEIDHFGFFKCERGRMAISIVTCITSHPDW